MNPDNIHHIGLGPPHLIPETSMDSRYLIPVSGMLRFIERGVPTENPEVMKKGRILQQYQWCAIESKFDWYDLPTVHESDL